MSINMFKKRIKRSRATWLGLLLRKGNSRSKLRKHHSERGIAIPLVIGVGLLMLLLSITVIVRSQSSQVNTSNLKQAATASEVAETGLARIQEIFNLNPSIALVSLTSPSSPSAPLPWRNLSEWQGSTVRARSSCPPNAASTVLGTMTPGADGWINIEAGKRQFRVVGYTFNATAGAATDTGVGKLELEGKIINGIGSPALSTSALQVTIPVNSGDINNVPIPGTWLGNDIEQSGNQTFASDILIKCDDTIPNNPAKPLLETKIPPYEIRKTGLTLPALPSVPSNASPLGALGNITVVLPKAGAGYNSVTGSYDYTVTELDKTTVQINPNYKVNIYLSGSIKKGTDIAHKSTDAPKFNGSSITTTTTLVNIVNPTTALSISSDTAINVVPNNPTTYIPNPCPLLPNQPGDCSVYGILAKDTLGVPGKLTRTGTTPATYTFTPTTAPPSGGINVPASSTFTPTTAYKEVDFKIYGSGALGSYICMNGNREIDAFILAPKYSFGIDGGGNGALLNGSIWVDSYPSSECSSSSNKIVVTQKGTWEDISLSPQNLPPSISATQTWNKKGAN